MNLQEQIYRIQGIMGLLHENDLPIEVRRRLNFSKEHILKTLRWFILEQFKDVSKEKLIPSVLETMTYEIMFSSGIFGLEETLPPSTFTEISNKIRNHLESEYKEDIENYYDSIFELGDDDSTFCFIKHSDLSMNIKFNRGFGDCVDGWYNFLGKYGSYFPDLDWNDIKSGLDQKPNQKFLIKRPLEGHLYHYYYTVMKRVPVPKP